MKAYVITTGTIFALFAGMHLFIAYEQWRKGQPDTWGPALIFVLSAGLVGWAISLLRGTSSTGAGASPPTG